MSKRAGSGTQLRVGRDLGGARARPGQLSVPTNL